MILYVLFVLWLMPCRWRGTGDCHCIGMVCVYLGSRNVYMSVGVHVILKTLCVMEALFRVFRGLTVVLQRKE